MTYQWVDYDPDFVRQRYDRLADIIPLFDWLFFIPAGLRKHAVDRLSLKHGDCVLDVGCGTGRNFPFLREAIGPTGRIYGVDLSAGMLRNARKLRDRHHWTNIHLTEGDAADYVAPEPLDGVLFSLSYNTMPHHLTVLRRIWKQLRPGGRLVIMDSKLPPGLGGKLLLPFSLWMMRHTLLGNPYIRPWEHHAQLVDDFEMEEFLFASYYVCRGVKPVKSLRGVRPPSQRRQARHDALDRPRRHPVHRSHLQVPAGVQRHASERGNHGADGKATYTNVPAAKPIIVQDLLRHSAGLAYAEITKNEPVKAAYVEAKFSQPGIHEYDSRGMTPAEQVERIAKALLIHQPGTMWEYSMAVDILGRVVEAASAKRLAAVTTP